MFFRSAPFAIASLFVVACAGSHGLGREPAVHRPSAIDCDHVRSDGSTPDPGAPASCMVDADCSTGENGRCTGNSHDGWACTYDTCFTDDACGAGGVCQCEGGFRSDANVCLGGDCRIDSDCGPGGYCSPSLGSCGDYGGIVGWFCHAAEDECIDDVDCADGEMPFFGGGYCAFDPLVGHFRCSTQQCAG